MTETLDLIPRQWQVGPARPREVLLPGLVKRSPKWPVPRWNFHVPFERLRRADDARAHTEDTAETGGTRTVTDGRHAAAITLLGNYMAGSFVATADGHGGALLTQAGQTGQHPLLTHPVP